MQLKLFYIRPELQTYIKSICMMICDDDKDILPFRVLPDTCVEIFISCNGYRIADLSGASLGSFVGGRMRSYMDVSMKKHSQCIAICFYPGAAYRFFGVSMSELSDASIELSHLWGNRTIEMEEKLTEARSPTEGVELVQEYLSDQLKIHAHVEGQIAWSLQVAERMKGQVSVKQLAEESHISERQLHRKYIRYLGISPKEYLCMVRFIHSLKFLKAEPQPDFTSIAYESGYYDQAHFNHEYRVFAGLSPGEILSSRIIIC